MAMTILSSMNFGSSWQPFDSTLNTLRLLKGKLEHSDSILRLLRGWLLNIIGHYLNIEHLTLKH